MMLANFCEELAVLFQDGLGHGYRIEQLSSLGTRHTIWSILPRWRHAKVAEFVADETAILVRVGSIERRFELADPSTAPETIRDWAIKTMKNG